MTNPATILSVVIPTYNERENLPLIVAAVQAALMGSAPAAAPVYEIIIVDDNSPDGTWQEAEALATQDKRIHLIRRIGRRGLSTAVVEGFIAAVGTYIAVIDADLQHDPSVLTAMLARAIEGMDLVVASRYMAGGDVTAWNRTRLFLSGVSTVLAKIVLRTRTSDPLSGYFLIRRGCFLELAPRLQPRGYKILMEILARSRLSCCDVPSTFSPRIHGESKLDAHTGMDAVAELYNLSVGRLIPIRFLAYCFVGATGVLVNLLTLAILRRCGLADSVSLMAAIAVAMACNFLLNNTITFYDQRRIGFTSVLSGMALFAAVCSVGALINYCVATFIAQRCGWGIYVGDVLGIMVATVWNFMLNRTVTWREVGNGINRS